MTDKFYKIFNIYALSLQIEWQLQLVLIKIGYKTKHNSQVCCAFENDLQMQLRAEKGPGGHYWICFEGTLPPLLISIRKLFLSDQVSARKQQLEAIL